MNRLKKRIAKNTFFTARIWWPTRIVLDNGDGTFDFLTLGFGAKVVCQIKQSMKAPMPTLEYIDYSSYEAQWLENIRETCSTLLGMSNEESESTAKLMLRKYGLDTYIRDALLDHFGDRIDKENLQG